MPFSRTFDPAAAMLLDEYAELLMRPREVAVLVADRFAGAPLPGSEASVDLAEKLFDERYNESLVSRPRGNAAVYLTGGANHLAGLATVLRQRELWFAPGLLARAAVEHGARAVVALDPRVELRTRVAFAVLDDALSAHFSKLAVSGLAGKQTPEYKATEARWNTIRRVAAECFDSVSFEGRPPQWNIEGHVQLGFTEVVESWCNWRDDELPGRGIYAALSLYAHPQTSVAQEQVKLEPVTGGSLITDTVLLRRFASVALAAWYDGMTLLSSYHGWEVEELDALGQGAALLNDPAADSEVTPRSQP